MSVSNCVLFISRNCSIKASSEQSVIFIGFSDCSFLREGNNCSIVVLFTLYTLKICRISISNTFDVTELQCVSNVLLHTGRHVLVTKFQQLGQSVSLSTYQPISLSACQPISLSSYQPVSLSAYQAISLSADQPVSLSVHYLSVFLLLTLRLTLTFNTDAVTLTL